MEKQIDNNITNKVAVPIYKSKPFYSFFKRFFDLFFSFLAIIILSWLLIIIFILVLISAKGRPIFKDVRKGLNGKNIKVYKFRSMYANAETNISKYLTPDQIDEWNRERKIQNDPRITKIGKFLRKTSLDELPQLFNILFGSLSIVGPRPIKDDELSINYTAEEKNTLLKVKPGLTGYWQVYGRSNVSYQSGERQKLELAYITKRSLLFDFKIIILTIPAVLKRKGAK